MLIRRLAAFRSAAALILRPSAAFGPLKVCLTLLTMAVYAAFPASGMSQSIASLVVTPTAVPGGTGFTGTVSLTTSAGKNGLKVAMFVTQSCVKVSSSITVPSGQTSVSVPFTTTPVSNNTYAGIRASANGTAAFATVQVAAPKLQSLSLNPASVIGGTNVLGSVTITSAAPTGGVLVYLGTTDPSVQVPDSVTVPSGATSVGFTATTTPLPQTVQSRILAMTDSAFSSVAVKVNAPTVKMAINPQTVQPGASATGVLTLTGPAPSGGMQIQVSGANALFTVPASVTIAAGATTGTFSAKAIAPPASGSCIISASVNGATVSEPISVASGLAISPWPKFHGDLQSSGLSSAPLATGAFKWQLHIGGADFFSSAPVLGHDGTVYIGASGAGDHHLYAINGTTGTVKWSYSAGDVFDATAAVGANGFVYCGSNDFHMYAFNASTGALKWKFATGGYVQGSPTIGSDGTVYFGSNDGNLYAVNGTTGALKWSYNTGGLIRGCPTIGYDGTIYFGSTDSNVYAVNGATGALVWKSRTRNAVEGAITLDQSGSIYMGSTDNYIYSMNAATGTWNWDTATGGAMFSSATVGKSGLVYCGSDDHNFYAFNTATGAIAWTLPTGNAIDSSAAIGPDGTVYIGSDDFTFFALNGSTGAVSWKLALQGYAAPAPAIGADGTIYVAAGDYVYAIK